jgi:hypothetical protein
MNEEPFTQPHDPEARWALFPLAPALGALAALRVLVGEALRVWNLAYLSDEVSLVVTELVTNAARSGQPFHVRFGAVQGGTSVYVEVFDTMPEMPGPSAVPDPWAEHGRGLPIIEAYSAEHGARPVPGGKLVWALIGPRARH